MVVSSSVEHPSLTSAHHWLHGDTPQFALNAHGGDLLVLDFFNRLQ